MNAALILLLTSPIRRFGTGRSTSFGLTREERIKQLDAATQRDAEIYMANHNSKRAKEEWAWLDRLCSRIHKRYLRLWGIK